MQAQSDFNKSLKSQINSIASLIPPVNSCTSFNAVTTRGGKTTRDPPYPNMTKQPARNTQEDKEKEEAEEPTAREENSKFYGKIAPHEFYDTNITLPFPRA